jgi:hypothetical protein
VLPIEFNNPLEAPESGAVSFLEHQPALISGAEEIVKNPLRVSSGLSTAVSSPIEPPNA